MPTDKFTSTLENLKIDISRELSNIDFWTNEQKIANYCLSILKYFGKEKAEVSVKFGNGCFEVQSRAGQKFYIEVPTIPMCKTPESYQKQIIARSIVLRHELGHALFTDTNIKLKKMRECQGFDLVFRFVEDARVEYLLATTLKGTRAGFVELSDIFYNVADRTVKIMVDKFSKIHALEYFMMKSNNLPIFATNDTTRTYEELFQKYEWVRSSLDIEVVYSTYVEMAEELEQLAASAKEKTPMEDLQDDVNQEQEEQDAPEDDVQENPEESEDGEEQEGEGGESEGDESEETDSEESADGNGQESEDGEEQQESQESQPTAGDGEGEESEDGEDESDSSPSSDGVDEEGESVEDEGDQTEEADDSHEPSNGGDNRNPETDCGHDGDGQEDEEDVEDPANAKTAMEDLTKDIQETYKIDFVDFMNTGIDGYVFDANTCPQASSLDLGKLFQITRTAMYAPKGGLEYNKVIREQAKNINEIVRFFSLKLQNRNRTRTVVYQQEGELDQDNLKEIVINPNDPRAFCRSVSKISPNSRIVFLIDASGSMNNWQLEQCMVTVIILAEVCKRMKLQYEVAFFTSQVNETFSVKKNISVATVAKTLSSMTGNFEAWVKYDYHEEKLNDALKNGRAGHTVEKISFREKSDEANRGAIYVLKSADEKHTRQTEYLLGNVYRAMDWFHKKISGGTPEFSSFITVYKRNLNFPGKKIMFVLNDGGYDTDQVESLLPKTDVEYNYNADGCYVNTSKENLSKIGNYLEALVKTVASKVNAIANNPAVLKNMTNKQSKYSKKKLSDITNGSKQLAEAWNLVLENISNIQSKMGTQYITVGALNIAKIEVSDCWGSVHAYVELENLNDAAQNIRYDITQYCGRKSVYNEVYSKIINKLRKTGYTICGFGIESAEGVEYMGVDNFQVINGAQDLKDSFSKKLMMVF